MSLLEPTLPLDTRQGEPSAASVHCWAGLTHRIGLVLAARQSGTIGRPPGGIPPYDEEAEWTIAARTWARETEGTDLLFPGAEAEVTNEEPLQWVAPRLREPEPDELVLGMTRARSAANIITREYRDYNAVISDALRKEGKFQVRFREESPTMRFAPGVIIDFPAFVISLDGKRVASGRLCVTVCLHESRSKVWTRFSALEDGFWGRTSCDQVAGFVGQTRIWFKGFQQRVLDLYQRHIEATLRESREPDPSVIFRVKHQIEFVSADTKISGLVNLASAIAQRRNFYADEQTRLAAEQVEGLVKCVPDMDIQLGTERLLESIAKSNARALESGGSYYLVPHRTARGSRGVYVARAHGPRLLFAGLASAGSDALVEVRRVATLGRPALGTPSQNVTAEIATTVAQYF